MLRAWGLMLMMTMSIGLSWVRVREMVLLTMGGLIPIRYMFFLTIGAYLSLPPGIWRTLLTGVTYA